MNWNVVWLAKLDRGKNRGHYKIATKFWYTVEIVTHLAKSPVERVPILDKNAYCPWYEIDKTTVDHINVANFNHATKPDAMLLVWDMSGLLGW